MNTSKMIRILDQLSERMANRKAAFTMHKMRSIGGGYKWWCRFEYENKYGGTVVYRGSDVSLDKALAGLIDNLDAAGLLGDD